MLLTKGPSIIGSHRLTASLPHCLTASLPHCLDNASDSRPADEEPNPNCSRDKSTTATDLPNATPNCDFKKRLLSRFDVFLDDFIGVGQGTRKQLTNLQHVLPMTKPGSSGPSFVATCASIPCSPMRGTRFCSCKSLGNGVAPDRTWLPVTGLSSLAQQWKELCAQRGRLLAAWGPLTTG